MSSIISIQQNPASSSLAQSPMIFSVNISNADMLASSSFQYMCELTYWRGSANDSGSFDYTLAKYPNESEYGIFDVSKIINSTLVEKREEILHHLSDYLNTTQRSVKVLLPLVLKSLKCMIYTFPNSSFSLVFPSLL